MQDVDADTGREQGPDISLELVLDGNAVAGLLYEIFAAEVTTSLTECASCGKQGEVGTLLVYGQAPGVVLRCPVCQNIVMRIVQTPVDIYLDARGVRFLRLRR